MNRFAWPQLMRLGLVHLRLPPATFWDMTPAELFLLAGLDEADGPMTRGGLETLLARYPDLSSPRNREDQP